MAYHIALLGDSIFDNEPYTDGDPDVVSHMRNIMPSAWRASLYAIDGSKTPDLKSQLPTVASDATHFVIAIGGNDALSNMELLYMPVTSTTAALELFGDRVAGFEKSYRAAIEEALDYERPTTLCTIYNADLEPQLAGVARTALMMFNDVILRVAFERQLPVIDLRLICNEPSDYAYSIEPSGPGGHKIATAVTRSIEAQAESSTHSWVLAG